MSVRVSVIIPCYNQGHFIREALASVAACDQTLIEVIIVNDGSTDPDTNKIMRELAEQGMHIIFQENKGLAAARNAGISASKGEFILPLDADNKIYPAYIEKGLAAMDADASIGVVYGNANYFGAKSGDWKPGVFNLQRLMIANFIDACALIRRRVLEEVGLYDEGMKYMGWEDWDRWLAISFAGYKFHYLNETVFDYRVGEQSMIRNLYNKYEKPNALENYIHAKYPGQMGHQWITGNLTTRFKKNPFLFLVKLIITAYFPAYHRKLLKTNKIRNGI